jgi:hypothetical protein
MLDSLIELGSSLVELGKAAVHTIAFFVIIGYFAHLNLFGGK